MPTISDLISISLKLDSSGLVQGEMEATAVMSRAVRTLEQQGADLERIAKNVGYGLEKVITGVAGFFGLVLTFEGFKKLVVDAAQAGTSMGRFAESIGKTVEITQAYKQAFQSFSGGETGILQTIRQMKLDLEAFPQVYTDWMSAVERVYAYAGQNKTVTGKEPEQILKDITEAVAKRHLSAAKLKSLLEGTLPLTDADILLLTKPGGLEEALEKQRKDIGTPTTPQAEALERLQADIANLENVSNLLKLQTAILLEPFLHKLITTTIDIINWLRSVATMMGMTQRITGPDTAVLVGGNGIPIGAPATLPSERSALFTGPSRRIVFDKETGHFKSVDDTSPAGSASSTYRGPYASAGGSGGITAPAGTPIQGGMVEIVTNSGKRFRVDPLYAENFRGFLNDYEAAGGVVGAESGTLGVRPANASGHPIGTAIDINQASRNVRTISGVSLPPDKEDELAAKWGLVSGHTWRNPDTGHFGIRSYEAAQEALRRQGIISGSPSGTVVKGSTFSDISTLSGLSAATTSGIALPSGGKMGDLYEITTPDGRKFIAPLIDRGPAQWTGRGLDISAPLAKEMGYGKDFPTGSRFGVRPYIVPQSDLQSGASGAARSFDNSRPKVENNQMDTHINQVNVHTHATDATGIAQDVKDAIGKQLEAPVQ